MILNLLPNNIIINILSYIGLGLVCFIILKIYTYFNVTAFSQKDFISFQKYLHKYYIRNITYELLWLILGIVSCFSIIFLVKNFLIMYDLYTVYLLRFDIKQFHVGNISKFILLFICFITFCYYYYNLLSLFVFRKSIKIYLYLYKYKAFTSFMQYILPIPLNKTGYNNSFYEKKNTMFKVYICMQTILILYICTEIFSGKLYYTYYTLLGLFLLKLFYKIYAFLLTKSIILDKIISIYFYKDDISYRKFSKQFIEEFYITQSENLKKNYINEYMQSYIDNNFRQHFYLENKNLKKKQLIIYTQQLFSICYFIIFKYSDEYLVLLCIPLIIMFYLCINMENLVLNNNILINKKYYMTFYILLILKVFIIYLFIIQHRFFFLDDEIILNGYITIKKTYSLEDKILFFQQYFKYLSHFVLSPEQNLYSNNIMTHLDATFFLNKTTSLRDIKLLVITLINATLILDELYFHNLKEILISQHITYCNELHMQLLKEKFWFMNPFINVINIITLTKGFELFMIKLFPYKQNGDSCFFETIFCIQKI